MSEGAKDWARRQEVGVARFTLFVMCEVVDDRLEYIAGNEYLCRETGKSLGTINRHLELLKKLQKITLIQGPTQGRFAKYRINAKSYLKMRHEAGRSSPKMRHESYLKKAKVVSQNDTPSSDYKKIKEAELERKPPPPQEPEKEEDIIPKYEEYFSVYLPGFLEDWEGRFGAKPSARLLGIVHDEYPTGEFPEGAYRAHMDVMERYGAQRPESYFLKAEPGRSPLYTRNIAPPKTKKRLL